MNEETIEVFCTDEAWQEFFESLEVEEECTKNVPGEKINDDSNP